MRAHADVLAPAVWGCRETMKKCRKSCNDHAKAHVPAGSGHPNHKARRCRAPACMGCPNSVVGAKYIGETLPGTPFQVLRWQDCCAACLLASDCSAWVHYSPTTGAASQCHLLSSVKGFNLPDPAGNQVITGIVSPSPQPLPPGPISLR